MTRKMMWEVVIGLETHTQLSTVSKIFSGASTAFGAAPNSQASAVDIALPGVLPVLNKGAVERAIRLGLAVGGTINRRSVFARKNYFYPDLPKGYQISQYEIPVVQGGEIAIISPTRGEIKVRLTRAHLEEDAGKSLHEDFHGRTGIDLNRAGTPLLEIVSEPDLRSAEEAVAYAKALHGLVRWIGICDGNMQEGSFRFDANVSVRPQGEEKLGTRSEIKNLNSFRFLQEAIEFEVRRQIELIEDGGTVVQETRLYDSDKRETRSMRSKEDAHDYRYFPDPDLPPLVIDETWIERVRSAMPEMPESMRVRFTTAYGLTADTAKLLASDKSTAQFFEHALAAARVDTVTKEGQGVSAAQIVANWTLGKLSAYMNFRDLTIDRCPVSARDFGHLLSLVLGNKITPTGADSVLREYLMEGKVQSPPAIDALVQQLDLAQISDAGTLEKSVDGILSANPAIVAEFRAGKEKAFNALVGKAMAATKGKANPTQINDILRRKLG
jgi:aspartyl-tRNA(Asn)/glutamyl-tRNA(Gln) amidotransferase subunit B